MRITNRMMGQAVLNNINRNLKLLSDAQDDLSTGTKLNRPSDDPVATSRVMAAKSSLRAHEQYGDNIRDAQGYLNMADDVCGQITEIVTRAKELAVYGASSTQGPEERQAIAEEIGNLAESLVAAGNTNYGGIYIFGGGYSSEPPFEASYSGDDMVSVSFAGGVVAAADLENVYSYRMEIEEGVYVDLATGSDFFHSDSEGNSAISGVFDTFTGMRDALENGDGDAVGEFVEKMDAHLNGIIKERSVVGAKSNRMELALNRSLEYNLQLTENISSYADVDYAEAAIQLQTQQAVYQAALATSADIIQPSLINYLK